MKALFSGKRRLSVRIKDREDELESVVADIIGNETHIFPSFWERIKILFGAGILVELAICCEVAPGKMTTHHEVHYVWPSRAGLKDVTIGRQSGAGDVMAQFSMEKLEEK